MWENILNGFIGVCFLSLFVALIIIVYERIREEEVKKPEIETKPFVAKKQFDNTKCKIESLARMIFSLKIQEGEDPKVSAKEAIEESKLFYDELNKKETTITFNDGTEVNIKDYNKRRCLPSNESQCSGKIERNLVSEDFKRVHEAFKKFGSKVEDFDNIKLHQLRKERDEAFQDLVDTVKGFKEKVENFKSKNSKFEPGGLIKTNNKERIFNNHV